ncbi:hypothetical protein [Oceanicola sp. 502str15]|uniref:hypothetical protein n=1 Tax=Oceanicola sp. 502str15 TaxID=2696061 RepID=UPI0020963853|nr:hypothetical protein [Oceanicola sp. 502str15]MCO6385071.1 hypothetical protein [Oceanicola sp. 502str15]
MSKFGKNPTVLSRVAVPAGSAALAVVAVMVANSMGGFSGKSEASISALDELAAAVAALEARTAPQPLVSPTALRAATEAPAPATPAPEKTDLAALAPTRGLELTLAPEAPAEPAPEVAATAQPEQDGAPLLLPVEDALAQVQPNITWSSMNPANQAPTTEDKLAELVAASASVELPTEPQDDAILDLEQQIDLVMSLAAQADAHDAAHDETQGEEHAALAGEGHDSHGDDHGMMEMMAPDPSLSKCTNEIKAMAHRAQIHFEPGSTELDSRGRAIALILARKAADCPQARITIEGFADPSGNYKLNTRIALARAENTLAHFSRLVGRTEGFSAKSHLTGESHPDFCPHYDVVDRRVQFIVEEAEMSLAQAD